MVGRVIQNPGSYMWTIVPITQQGTENHDYCLCGNYVYLGIVAIYIKAVLGADIRHGRLVYSGCRSEPPPPL
jgi:hypothetical protein